MPARSKPTRRKPKVLGREAALATLHTLARDLWWSWNEIAQRPFAALAPTLWRRTRRSPLGVLQGIDPQRLDTRLDEEDFRALVQAAEEARQAYYAAKTWYERTAKKADEGLRVAYFCSEYAVHESLAQYSGGLGVLAGDHLKSASDLGVPFVAVGLLYRHGYYFQELRSDGSHRVVYPETAFGSLPIEDTGVVIDCPLGERRVRAKVWRQKVGRVSLYLLDANLPDNDPEDRVLTEGLYKGEPDLRLRQQVLLGVGGVRALRALNESITVFHLNEGHAAFCHLERLAGLVEDGVALGVAEEQVASSSVFTTHTPVPAGHDRYGLADVRRYLADPIRRAGLAEHDLRRLGLEHPENGKEPVCMTVLAFRLAKGVNGVAELHGQVSREMWAEAYGVTDPKHVPITHVTNGVHSDTWIDPVAKAFWRKHAGIRLDRLDPVKEIWGPAEKVDRQAFWAMRRQLRARLIQFTRERLVLQAERRGEDPAVVLEQTERLDPDALTLGFARRFATYKRAPLIFTDKDRLAKLIANAERPVQLIFAGKAHPRDTGGQAFAQKIHMLSRDKRFAGRVVLLEEYDMEIGRMLTSGVDVWLNTPLRPHEASGTSGMKPPMHGGLNCSILDGWWCEGFDGVNGWAIGDEEEQHSSQRQQDLADAHSLYDLLETEIVPEFYTTNRQGLPLPWIKRALRSAATVPDYFNTHRMVGEYVDWLYKPGHARA